MKCENNVVYPEASDEVIVNPGMGWTTFNSFNGDEVNRNYPRSSIAYFRLYWDQLEPEEGIYNWDIIDDVFTKARQNGQDVALRVSAMNGVDTANESETRKSGVKIRNYRVPEWFRGSGAKGGEYIGKNNKSADPIPIWEPDYGDPMFLEKHGRFISELGRRYDGNPNLDHMDLGSMGRWGEWHFRAAVSEPHFEARKRIIDIYLEAFPRTPLLIPLANEEAMAYAVSKGVGWRADCIGDSRQGYYNPDWKGGTPDFNHLDDIYLQRLVGAGAVKAWKRAPVAFESCWNMKYWYEQGWNVDHIFAYALALHVSVMNNKSSAIPDEWWPQVKDFSRKMGYRFVPRKLEYPSTVTAGGRMSVSMIWENKGMAPCYRNYVLAFRIREVDGDRQVILKAGTDIRKWLPGRYSVNEMITLPTDFPMGECRLSLAVVSPENMTPGIRLAIKGDVEDGWYPLGNLFGSTP